MTLQENHKIKTNFKYKKYLVGIMTRLEIILETKKKNFWF